jgi:hypothetical protein
MDGAPLRTLPKVSSGTAPNARSPLAAGVRPLGHTLLRFGLRLFAGLPAPAMRAELARPGLQFVNEHVQAQRAESGGGGRSGSRAAAAVLSVPRRNSPLGVRP